MLRGHGPGVDALNRAATRRDCRSTRGERGGVDDRIALLIASHAPGVHQLYKAPDRPVGLARPARDLDRKPSRAEYVQITAVAVSGFHLPKGRTLPVWGPRIQHQGPRK